MADVFVKRPLDGPAGESGLQAPGQRLRDCFDLHRVQWRESVLSADGQYMICRFTAVDAESVRLALRQSGIGFTAVWSDRRTVTNPL